MILIKSLIYCLGTVIVGIIMFRYASLLDNMNAKRAIKITIIYFAFPFVNLASPTEVNPGWMLLLNTIIYNHLHMPLILIPWLAVMIIIVYQCKAATCDK